MSIWHLINTDISTNLNPDWCGTDSRHTWQQNCHRPELKGYVTEPVHYQINPAGFRSEYCYTELANCQTPVVVYLGCSHTYGVGHHGRNTWHHRVTQYTGLTPVNLAVPGAGVEFSHLILMRYIQKLNIHRVYHFQPVYSRWLIRSADRLKTIRPDLITDPVVQNNWSDPGYTQLSHYRNVKACQQMCAELDIEYWHSDGSRLSTELQVDLYNPDVLTESDIPARDLQHFPVSWHELIAEYFIDQTEPLDWQLDDLSLNY